MERDNRTVVGEVNCVNCGRTVAEAVAEPGQEGLRLRPAPYRMVLHVRLDGHTLRCTQCQGRAFIERVLPRDVAPAVARTRSAERFAGAA
jgi:DNA-directed RNA polymerase subunit RPC12/RpoP